MIEDEPDPTSKIIVTDSDFGGVVPGDKTFLSRFEGKFGYRPKKVAWMNQVHGKNIEYVDADAEEITVFPETDGIWTDQKGIMLITKTADCVPILLRSQSDGIIAALHCGWRGFFAGIIEEFAMLCHERGFKLKDFSAYLGPHLRIKNFEVQDDFVEQIPEDKKKFLREKDGKKYFGITAGVIEALHSIGIKNVEESGIDTYTDPQYFSYRLWNRTPESKRTENYSTFANCIILN